MQNDTITFDGPGSYNIVVKEKLHADVLELMVDDFPENQFTKEKKSQIILRVKDQAQLSGFLNILYDYHYTLLKIERI